MTICINTLTQPNSYRDSTAVGYHMVKKEQKKNERVNNLI